METDDTFLALVYRHLRTIGHNDTEYWDTMVVEVINNTIELHKNMSILTDMMPLDQRPAMQKKLDELVTLIGYFEIGK